MATITARINAVCDAAAALILANWPDKVSADGCLRTWTPEIQLTEDIEQTPPLTGRWLFVIPAPDAYSADLITRNDQQRNYKFRVLMVERYVPADENAAKTPPDSWIDDRVEFFEQNVFNLLANQANVLIDEVVPALDENASVGMILDTDVLLQHKAFWGWAEFPYCEDLDLTGKVVLS